MGSWCTFCVVTLFCPLSILWISFCFIIYSSASLFYGCRAIYHVGCTTLVCPLRLHVGYLGCFQCVEGPMPWESVLSSSSLPPPWLKLACTVPHRDHCNSLLTNPQAPSYTLLARFYVSDHVTLVLPNCRWLPSAYTITPKHFSFITFGLGISKTGWLE